MIAYKNILLKLIGVYKCAMKKEKYVVDRFTLRFRGGETRFSRAAVFEVS